MRHVTQFTMTMGEGPIRLARPSKRCDSIAGALLVILLALICSGASHSVRAQAVGPTMLHPQLAVETVVTGLITPTSLAFLDANDLLVLEKNTGRVRRIVNGVIQATVLDLAVNFGSERGLLGMALHPDFPANPGVYLYWTESTTGGDTDVLSETPLLGNRVDRFVWNGSTLTFAHNLIRLRALQPPFAAEPTPAAGRGNHDGGVITFSPDRKLYIFVGDVGRRGQLQNLPDGPFGPGQPDDQFGGPEPDDEHLTGVILRLNDDGTAPTDNPFFAVGAAMGGEVGANLQKVFSYGHRNSFGMAFDPVSGDLWLQENGDDSFSELNRVEPGMNGGWVQIAGPVARIAQYKEIETTFGAMALQQQRWPPTNIADTPEEALFRLFMLPGAHYSDPEFSWRWEVAPGGIGFLNSRALGPQFEGDLFVGAATPLLEGGYLFHFNLPGNRRTIGVNDPRLEDRVADNLAKHDITESESLRIGRDFGVATDIETGPNGNLFVVSLTHGAIYEIHRRLEVAIKQGRAERLGTTNAKVTIEGQFADSSLTDLDLGASTMTITSVLNEAGVELVASASLPLTLEARPGSDADGATFETPGGKRPKVRVDMSRRDEGVVSVRLVVEFAPSQKPAMCTGTPRTTPVTTSFQLDPPLVSMTTTQPWQCLAGDSELRVPVP